MNDTDQVLPGGGEGGPMGPPSPPPGESAADYLCRRLGRMFPAAMSITVIVPNTATNTAQDPVTRPTNPATTRPPVRWTPFNFRLALNVVASSVYKANAFPMSDESMEK